MCQRIQCKKCGKPGYTGCGAHIEQVLGDVPKEKRCQCASSNTSASSFFQNLFRK
jgi:hypothetical protein